jgi:hypothetical protein
MSVFRDITLTYKGKDYTFTPSMRLMRRIDAQLAPQTLLGVAHAIDRQRPSMPELALIASEFLQAAGEFRVSEDEIYVHLMDEVTNGGGDLARLCGCIGYSLNPTEEAAKKLSAVSIVAD